MDAPNQRRPRNRIDLTGQTFGELTARSRMPKEAGVQGEKWLCDCSCGRQTIVRVKDITHFNTRSCGHLTGRPRPAPDTPHRAADLYPDIKRAVLEALGAGRSPPHAALRERYRGRLSHGTYYRYVHKAEAEFRAVGHAGVKSDPRTDEAPTLGSAGAPGELAPEPPAAGATIAGGAP